MSEIVVSGFPPSTETVDYGRAVLPQRRMTPGAVGGLDGPAGPVGPERAGALTLTFGAFAEDALAQRGYRQFTDMQHAMLSAPGFLRWLSFADGPHGYGLGLWRTTDEALAFVRGGAHRAAVAAQHSTPFEYSQFAGVYAAHTVGRRTLYCTGCGSRVVAPASTCGACGLPVNDGFAG